MLDFPGRDSQDEEHYPGKGSKAAPSTVPKTVGSKAQDEADDEDDEGFKMVGDDEGVHGDQVIFSILAEKVLKPEDSGFDRKGKMFESEDDDDPKVQEQIKMVLASTGLLGDLQLSESKDESKWDSPSSDDDEGDPNKTKQYYKDQEDEAAKDSWLKPNSSIPAVTDPPAVLGKPGNLDGSNPGTLANDAQPTKPIPSKGKGPNSKSSSKAPASKSGTTTQPSAAARGVQEHMQSTLFGVATLAQAADTEEDSSTPRELHRFTHGTAESSHHHGKWVQGSHGRYPGSASFYLGRGNPAQLCLCCWGFPGPCQLDREVSTGHESRGEPVPA